MNDPKPKIMILCEDLAHYRLLRSFLDAQGLRHLPPRFSPAGRGAAEEYVRKQYATERRAFRGKRNHLALILLVMIDGDGHPHAERLRLFEREDDESIIIFIPQRNIESWFNYFKIGKIDEKNDFRHAYRKHVAHREVAAQLLKLCRTDENTIPHSLNAARGEWRRVVAGLL
ncbi:MAG: hypothetical protein HQM03_19185 [Magnetococcales bacterium]|nr:hypothetical protein [Magnetococcales bacterium]